MIKSNLLGLIMQMAASAEVEKIFNYRKRKKRTKEVIKRQSFNCYWEPEYKQQITVSGCRKKFSFWFKGSCIFTSQRMTIENAWQDFVKNFWYLESNRNKVVEIIDSYKDDLGFDK